MLGLRQPLQRLTTALQILDFCLQHFTELLGSSKRSFLDLWIEGLFQITIKLERQLHFGSHTTQLLPPLRRHWHNHLGIPLYDELSRPKRHVIGGTQRWKNEEWPPERILETYGPATWAQDGSWGYQTPIYMLNCIIRLQALIEVIANETALAIDLLNTQQKQTRAAVYQNRLALDYLLADEGGVYGKFNTSDCCLHIDDHGEAITKITQNIRKLAHVPVQTWQSMTTPDWWKSLFSGQWWKKALIIIGFLLAGLIFLPCLIPCFIKLITSVVQAMPLIQDLQKQQLQQAPSTTPKVMQLTCPKQGRKNGQVARKLLINFQTPDPIPEELSTFV